MRAAAKAKIVTLLVLALLLLAMPTSSGSPPFSEDPADYLLFDSGDIPADGIPAADGEALSQHGWTLVGNPIYDAEYDVDGPTIDTVSIFSPELGTDLGHDLPAVVSNATYQVMVYDNLDSFAYTNVRTFTGTGSTGGEIAIWTDDRPGRGGSVTHYSVWDGSWHTTTALRTEGWHTFTIHVADAQTDYYIDGALVHSDTVPRATDLGGVGLLSSGQTSPFNETQEVWFDDLLVWAGAPADQPLACPSDDDDDDDCDDDDDEEDDDGDDDEEDEDDD